MPFRAHVHVNAVLIREVGLPPAVQSAIQTKRERGAGTCFTQTSPLGAQAADTS
jgi:hypothetical protein